MFSSHSSQPFFSPSSTSVFSVTFDGLGILVSPIFWPISGPIRKNSGIGLDWSRNRFKTKKSKNWSAKIIGRELVRKLVPLKFSQTCTIGPRPISLLTNQDWCCFVNSSFSFHNLNMCRSSIMIIVHSRLPNHYFRLIASAYWLHSFAVEPDEITTWPSKLVHIVQYLISGNLP